METDWSMSCPVCKSPCIAVKVATWAALVEGGAVLSARDLPDYDHEWDDDSSACCLKCGYTGIAGAFGALNVSAETKRAMTPRRIAASLPSNDMDALDAIHDKMESEGHRGEAFDMLGVLISRLKGDDVDETETPKPG